jgi:hypothetical protein
MAAVMTMAMMVAMMVAMTVAEMAAEMAYWRGHWFISSVSEIRIIWNITSPGYLNNDRPWSSV